MKWINTAGLDKSSYKRLCAIADFLSYESYEQDFASVTTLNNPPKIVILQKRYYKKLFEDPSDVVWRIIGSAVHEVMYNGLGYGYITREKEKFADNLLQTISKTKLQLNKDDKSETYTEFFDEINKLELDYQKSVNNIDLSLANKYVAEDRLRVNITYTDPETGEEEELTISGMNDLYDKHDKSIIDYKVTGVDKILMGSYSEWEKQLNAYAYLRRVAGQEVEKLEVNALLRDWKGREAKYNADYPNHPLIVIDLPLWSLERQQEYLEERVKVIKECIDLADDDIPVCTKAERWQQPDKIAIMEVKKFSVTASSIKEISKNLNILDTAEPLKKLIGKEYKSKELFLTDVRDIMSLICTPNGVEEYVKEYSQLLCSATGVVKVDAKGKRKRAARVVTDVNSALDWVDWKNPSYEWILEKRKSEPIRCMNYCGVRDYCNFWKSYSGQ